MEGVSIVIRTFNEERWIRHCLEMVFSQDSPQPEVVIVDNCSTDKTVEIAKSFPVAEVVSVDNYSPGAALNLGFSSVTRNLVGVLSAHCIPVTRSWLTHLADSFENPQIAGTYGRQRPMSFSDPIDALDLNLLFGLDRRIQEKDYFFHNANSMIRHEIWSKFPFDETVNGLEDRLWAKEVLSNGLRVAYEPDAEVYHYNGLHRSTDAQRQHNHTRILSQLEQEEPDLPESMRPDMATAVPIILISSKDLKTKDFEKYLVQTVECIEDDLGPTQVILASPGGQILLPNVLTVPREEIEISDGDAVDLAFAKVVKFYEACHDIPDYYIFVNWAYKSRPKRLFRDLVHRARTNGLDTVFAAIQEYGHYWTQTEDGNFVEMENSLAPRDRRSPTFRALYGLGTLVVAELAREGTIVGSRVGILPLEQSRLPRIVTRDAKISPRTRSSELEEFQQ